MKKFRFVLAAVLCLAAISIAPDARSQTCVDYKHVQDSQNTCGLQSRLTYCYDLPCTTSTNETRYGISRQHDSTAPSIAWSFFSPAITPSERVLVEPESTARAFENA